MHKGLTCDKAKTKQVYVGNLAEVNEVSHVPEPDEVQK